MTPALRRKLALSKVIAKAWTDEAFRNKLTESPKETLKEFGLDFDSHKEINVVQNTASVHYFVLPQKPETVTTLNEQELYSAAGAELEFTGMINKDSGTA